MEIFVANFLIALREGVEAALVVGILIAYIYKVGRKDIMPKLWLGVALAAVIPLGLGVWWTWGPYTITFQTQEILGGSLSIVAMAFVTWMIFWMGKNSRKLAQSVRAQAEEALDAGNVMGLVWLAIISVGREGPRPPSSSGRRSSPRASRASWGRQPGCCSAWSPPSSWATSYTRAPSS